MSEALVIGALVWEVVLPDKRAGAIGGPKPKGALVISPNAPDEEKIYIPVQVARIISSKERSGEISPGSRAELLYMLDELSRLCASTKIEKLINRREYSEQEVREKLRQDGYSQKTIQYCVERACEVGLISDRRYADAYIRSKLYAGWGMQRIERELKQRNIDVNDLVGWPYDYFDPDDELERATSIARNRHVSGANPYQKLVRHLCSKGFSLDVACKAAKKALADEQDEF